MNMSEYFQFLDELRESGVTNMYGASPYLSDAFDLDKYQARRIVQEWMKFKSKIPHREE